jgi:hypothetical protein
MKKNPLPDFSVSPPNGSDLIIEGFLHRESLAPRQQELCPECGSVMPNMESTFYLVGTEKSWTLALPVCLFCERDARPTIRPHLM